MNPRVVNRLALLGAVWGFILAAVPAAVMSRPFEPTFFLIASVVAAVICGVAATLYAGMRAYARSGRPPGKSGVLSGIATGLFQGLVGGVAGALFIWALMAVSISGVSLSSPGGLSDLMRPSVFIGSFFVALSAFVYALAGGLLLGPVFGTIINRTVQRGDG